MNLASAVDFLKCFGQLFTNEVVRSWAWQPEDDEFGRAHHWLVRPGSLDEVEAEVSASVDLQIDQLQLVVSERTPGEGSSIVLNVLVQFVEQTLLVDGEPAEFSGAEITRQIATFNQRTAD